MQSASSLSPSQSNRMDLSVDQPDSLYLPTDDHSSELPSDNSAINSDQPCSIEGFHEPVQPCSNPSDMSMHVLSSESDQSMPPGSSDLPSGQLPGASDHLPEQSSAGDLPSDQSSRPVACTDVVMHTDDGFNSVVPEV